MQRRILFLDALSEVAGGQRVLLQLVPALHEHELHALLPDPGPLSQQLEARGVRCHFARMADFTLVNKTSADIYRFSTEQIVLARRCQGLARRYSADLIYANSSRTFVWGALGAQMSRRPLVWHVHNVIGDGKTRALLRTAGRAPSVRRIIAASQQAADEFGGLARKTTVLPAGVDTEKFRPDPAARMRARTDLGLAADDQAVGIVGDLMPLKGQHTVLEACNSLPHPPVCLIVGAARANHSASVAYETKLRKLASGRTIFTGRWSDMPAVLNALDLLIIASERETGPLALLEGMACGTPIVSTPVGRAVELLPDQCLVPGDDASVLASKIRRCLDDPDKLKSLGARNREIAQDRLSIEQFRQSIVREISGLLDERR